MTPIDHLQAIVDGIPTYSEQRTEAVLCAEMKALEKCIQDIDERFDDLAKARHARHEPWYAKAAQDLLAARATAMLTWAGHIWVMGGVDMSISGDEPVVPVVAPVMATPVAPPVPAKAKSRALPGRPRKDNVQEALDTKPAVDVPEVAASVPAHPRPVSSIPDLPTARPFCAAPSIVLDPEMLASLAANLRNGQPTQAASPTFDTDLFQTLANLLGPPPTDLSKLRPVHDEVMRLEAFNERLEDLCDLPAEDHRALLQYAIFRARSVQGPAVKPILLDLSGDAVGRVDALFSKWTKHSALKRPGFMYGLSRSHVSGPDGWDGDAYLAWTGIATVLEAVAPLKVMNADREVQILRDLLNQDAADDVIVAQLDDVLSAGVAQVDVRLVRMLSPYPGVVKLSRFRALRHAIRDAAKVDDEEAEKEAVPTNWPFLAEVRGRRVIMLGGTPREHARQRIHDALALSDLQWPTIDRMQVLDNLCRSIRAGTIDLVIILQSFASHRMTDKVVVACKESDVPFVPIEHGYGVTRIQHAYAQHVAGLHMDGTVAARAA